jgi:hypothetical protein
MGGGRALSLLEKQPGFGANTVVFHHLGSCFRLHELLKCAQVGDLYDQPDPI